MKKLAIIVIVALSALVTIAGAFYFCTWYSSQERQLPQKDLAKLDGKAGFAPPDPASFMTGYAAIEKRDFRMFEGTLYNGSQWRMTRLILGLSAEFDDGSIKWTRDYSAEVSIPPNTDGSFSIPISNSEDVAKARWFIKEAFGYKQ